MSASAESLYLEKQLCFPLYAASRLTTKIYAPLLKELDITYPQYLVLLVLWQHGEQSVNKIGNRLFLESNTVTPLLKRLEQKELISRNRSAEDERSVRIALTPKGELLKTEAMEIPEKIIGSFEDDSIDKAEILQFQKTLCKLVEILGNQSKTGNG